MPDLMIFWKRVWGIELKTSKGRLSKTRVARTRRGGPRMLIGQDDMFEALLDSGAWAAIEVARSLDEVCGLLDFWEIPRNGGGRWLQLLSGERPGATYAELAAGSAGGGDTRTGR